MLLTTCAWYYQQSTYESWLEFEIDHCVIVNSSCKFGTFDHLKGLVSGGRGVLSPGQRMLCGLGAGVTEAVLVVTWIETLKAQGKMTSLCQPSFYQIKPPYYAGL